MYLRRESNPDQQFRKLLFYPLNYRDNSTGKGNDFAANKRTFYVFLSRQQMTVKLCRVQLQTTRSYGRIIRSVRIIIEKVSKTNTIRHSAIQTERVALSFIATRSPVIFHTPVQRSLSLSLSCRYGNYDHQTLLLCRHPYEDLKANIQSVPAM